MKLPTQTSGGPTESNIKVSVKIGTKKPSKPSKHWSIAKWRAGDLHPWLSCLSYLEEPIRVVFYLHNHRILAAVVRSFIRVLIEVR
jgi:hypothetical protein